jgi:hypothetical protein
MTFSRKLQEIVLIYLENYLVSSQTSYYQLWDAMQGMLPSAIKGITKRIRTLSQTLT